MVSRLHQRHPSTVLVNPVVALVFLVGEHGRGRFFVEACGGGETAGAGADDEDVEEVGELGHFLRFSFLVSLFEVCG